MRTLWVEYRTSQKSILREVCTSACGSVSDLIDSIRKVHDFDFPHRRIIICRPDGTGVLVADPIESLSAGNSKDTPLVVNVDYRFGWCNNRFYSTVEEATEQDGWLTFPHSMPQSMRKGVFVRDSYRSIASSILSGSNRKSLVTGTTGVGKSNFMFYLLWKLVSAKKSVLFVGSETILYSSNGGVLRCPANEPPSTKDIEFWNPDLWCLFDDLAHWSHESLFYHGFDLCSFVLATTPFRTRLNDFVKHSLPHVFYVPPWSERELESIAPSYHGPRYPRSIDWRHRFEVLGGIPRTIWDVWSCGAEQILEMACSDCTLGECVELIDWTSTCPESQKHRLIHMTSVDPFTERSVVFASETALRVIARTKAPDIKRLKQDLLVRAESNHLAAAVVQLSSELEASEHSSDEDLSDASSCDELEWQFELIERLLHSLRVQVFPPGRHKR